MKKITYHKPKYYNIGLKTMKDLRRCKGALEIKKNKSTKKSKSNKNLIVG